MSWFQIVPTLACALALAVVPGGLLAFAAGARTYYLLGLAAPLSISIIALSGILASVIPVSFGPIPIVVVTVVTCVAAALIRLLLRRAVAPPAERGGWSSKQWIATAVAMILAGSLIGARFVQIIGRPDNFSQTYDNIFHMSAIRYITDTGVGSSLSMGTLGTGPDVFYPAAWHNYVALIQTFTGVSIPAAITASSLIIGAFIWPASCLFLAAVAFGPRTLILLGTAVVSTGFSSFPYLMINFGVLYPYLLALALLPVPIGLLCELFGVGVKRMQTDRRVAGLFVAALIPGIGLSHPSVLLFVLLMALCLSPLPFIRRMLGPVTGKQRLLTAAAMLGVLIISTYAVMSIWNVARPSRGNSFWPPFQTEAQAVGEIMTLAPMGAPAAWLMMALVLVGVYSAFRYRLQRWTLVPLLLGSFLYIVVTAFPNGNLRYFITGVWYNDSYRLAALLPIALLPVMIAGWRTISSAFERKLLQVSAPEPQRIKPSLVGINVIAVVLLAAASQGEAVRYAVSFASGNYGISEKSRLISADEAALLKRVPELVPESATVVGNPFTGASLVYALADRSTPSPHVGNGQNRKAQVLINHLDEMLANPEVCPVVNDVGPVFALGFGGGEIHGGDHPFAGIDNMSPATGFELVAQEGDAVLWEAVGCSADAG